MNEIAAGREHETANPQLNALFSAKEQWPLIVCIGVFSLLYFVGTVIRASEKPFWFDELCSLYIVRLPSFADSWQAVLHGADFNPPLFYLMHRAARALFGEGLIVTRLPEIISFWIFCLCLFRYARELAGWRAGLIAMVLPILSGAYYYAYEERPHGLVLGFCGLALVAWQESERPLPRRGRWLLAFSLCMAAAFFTHCYAVVIAIPFGLVELARSVFTRSIKPTRWMALVTPAVAAAVAFIPLLRAYRTTMGGTGFGWHDVASSAISRIPAFYSDLLAPCILIVLVALLLLSAGWRNEAADSESERNISGWDALLIAGFLAMPVYGIILARLSKGPFFARYFMTGAVGVCLVIALGVTRERWRHASTVLAVLVIGTLLTDTCLVALRRVTHRPETLVEPSTKWAIDTTVGDPLASRRWMMTHVDDSLPIVVAFQLDFLYLVHYWPAAKERLYSISTSTHELQYRLYTAVEKYCHVGYHMPQTYDEFIPSHTDFFVYGDASVTPVLGYLKNKGAAFEALRFDDFGNFLVKVHMNTNGKVPVER